MAVQGRALRFDPTKAHHVDHGYFWVAGEPYTTFYWDYFVRPTQTSDTGYVISAGYGGAHNLLSGFDSSTTHTAVSGNIWDGDSVVNFGSEQFIPLGDWVHVAVIWDLSNIMVYVNGVIEGVTAYAAVSRSTPTSADSSLYVGGSTHLNLGMDLKWIRGFEGVIPATTANYAPFRPERYPKTYYRNSDTDVDASFACDYTVQAEMIPDLSSGLSGIKHNGRRAIGGDQGSFQNAGTPIQNTFDDADLPQWVNATVAVPTEITPTIPPTAKIYDGFNRTTSPFWDNTVALGSTEGGTLGVLAWQGSTGTYGCSYGRVFSTDPNQLQVYVDSGSQTQDIRVTFTGSQHQCQILFRYTDANNYMYIEPVPVGNGTDTLYVVKVVAGSPTVISSGVTAASTSSAESLRVTISGTQLDVYYDGVSRYSGTPASLPMGTKVGFTAKSSIVGKIDTFEAY
jgi:hypothetical protein